MSVDVLPSRDDIPSEQTWDLASVYPSDIAWAAAVEEAEAATSTFARFQGRLGESVATLLGALRERDRWVTIGWRLRQYANMQLKVNSADAAAGARLQRANSARGAINAAFAFLEPELLGLDGTTLDSWLASDGELAVYAHYVDTLRRRQRHVRTPTVEAAFADAETLTSNPYAIYRALLYGDLRFPNALDDHGRARGVAPNRYDSLLREPDRVLRRNVWESYSDTLYGVRHTLAQSLYGAIARDVYLARGHGYDSSLEAALEKTYLPREAHTTLLESWRRHLPLWHRAFRIRRQMLGVSALYTYDLDVPLARRQPRVPYDEARTVILDALAPLGDEYVGALRAGLYEQRWVDWATNAGKAGGADQSGVHGTHPFVFLSYDGSVVARSALAHELGHAMHSYYTWQTQPPVYEEFADYLTETASTFHQTLLRAYLLRQTPDRDTQLAVLSEALAYYHRYLFVMPLLSVFELDAHDRVERGEGLSADWIAERILRLLRDGYGDTVTLDDRRDGMWWAQFPHLFLNFYTHTYALGVAGANTLASAVESEGAPAAERYVRLLRSGDSVYPLDALREAGVDLTSPEPLERAFASLSDLLDRVEHLA
jgi:oligoendopeptidase F